MIKYDDESDEIKILWRLVRFSRENFDFHSSFLEKINEFYEENEYITHSQYEVLLKIYNENKLYEFYDNYE